MSEEEIFHQALARSCPDERAAYLQQACAGNPALRASVEALLLANVGASGFMERPLSALAATLDEPMTEHPGTVIGPYKLLEQIGEGGFGLVFMAEQQQPIRRKVAVKVLKPGMDTRQVIARFEAERQALALMDHPNIARVLEAGETASGRPYFVMELVRGVPITDFCDQNTLTPRERLELFVPVCQAVQHAHQKGIIHRDIKPSNVLVTLHDGTPVAKVIDFGIAKALGQQLTEKSLYTGFAQMIGTPMYMSPEQAALSGLDVDTRSDIYSLGVLLYELLTGTTPFDKERLGQVAYDEMRRIIREEVPPKPSTRIRTLGQAATTLSTQRRSDPRRLSQSFRGELDWIVMKALEKDRNRRYETASAFAADVQRYLHDEPVQAYPPSTWYRFRKFARRYRAALATASTLLFVLVAGVVISTWQAIRASQALDEVKVQRDEAEANFRKACQAVNDQFTLVSQSKLFDAPGLQYLRKDLLESALKYYQEFRRQRPDDPVLQAEVAAAYLRLFDVYQRTDSGLSVDAILALEKGVEIVEKLLREHLDDAEVYRRLAGFSKGDRAFHGFYSERVPRADPLVALPLLERAVRIWEDFARLVDLQDKPSVIGFQIDLAALYGATGEIQAAAGQSAEALATRRKAHAILEKIVRENPKVAEYQAGLAGSHDGLTWGLRPGGPPEEIEHHFRRALELMQKVVDECPEVSQYRASLALYRRQFGEWLADTGRFAEAEQAYRQAVIQEEKLVIEVPNVPRYRGELGSHYDVLGHLLRDTGRAEKAVEAYLQALAIWEKLATEFPMMPAYRFNVVGCRETLSQLLRDTGRAEKGEEVCGQALVLWEKLATEFPMMPAYRVNLAGCHDSLGHLFRDTGRAEKAEEAYRQARAIHEKLAAEFPNGEYRLGLAFNAFCLCPLLAASGRAQEAEQIYRKALEFKPETPDQYNGLAWLLVTCPDPKFRDPSRAVDLAKKALKALPYEGGFWNTLGLAHYRTGNWKDAVAALEKSMQLTNGGVCEDWFILAMAHWQLGDKEQARQWYGRAVQWMEKNRPREERTRLERRCFRAEAAECLGIKEQPKAKVKKKPHAGAPGR